MQRYLEAVSRAILGHARLSTCVGRSFTGGRTGRKTAARRHHRFSRPHLSIRCIEWLLVSSLLHNDDHRSSTYIQQELEDVSIDIDAPNPFYELLLKINLTMPSQPKEVSAADSFRSQSLRTPWDGKKRFKPAQRSVCVSDLYLSHRVLLTTSSPFRSTRHSDSFRQRVFRCTWIHSSLPH